MWCVGYFFFRLIWWWLHGSLIYMLLPISLSVFFCHVCTEEHGFENIDYRCYDVAFLFISIELPLNVSGSDVWNKFSQLLQLQPYERRSYHFTGTKSSKFYGKLMKAPVSDWVNKILHIKIRPSVTFTFKSQNRIRSQPYATIHPRCEMNS